MKRTEIVEEEWVVGAVGGFVIAEMKWWETAEWWCRKVVYSLLDAYLHLKEVVAKLFHSVRSGLGHSLSQFIQGFTIGEGGSVCVSVGAYNATHRDK